MVQICDRGDKHSKLSIGGFGVLVQARTKLDANNNKTGLTIFELDGLGQFSINFVDLFVQGPQVIQYPEQKQTSGKQPDEAG